MGAEIERTDSLEDSQPTARSRYSRLMTGGYNLLCSFTSATVSYASNHLPSRENLSFLAAWVKSPFKMGALFPLTEPAAKLMASAVRVKEGCVVAELGAGTGVVTTKILEQGIPQNRLFCIEQNEIMYKILTKNFPNANIIQGDACAIGSLLERHRSQVSSVISTLPFRLMSTGDKDKIIQAAFAVLEDGGNFVQISTYYPSHNFDYKKHKLVSRYIGWNWGGFVPPLPCFVFSYTKEKAD